MDEIDKQIVEILSKQGRLQWKELGEAVHLSGPAAAERVRRLEKQGIICGYKAVVDESKTGRATTALITIILSSGRHGPVRSKESWISCSAPRRGFSRTSSARWRSCWGCATARGTGR